MFIFGMPPKPKNVGARLLHERQVGGMPRQLEREVGFHRRVHFARPAVVNVPAAVRQLPLQNVANAALLDRVIHFAEPMHEEDEIGAERAIDDQLAAPVAIRALLPQQIFLGATNRVCDLGIVARIRRMQRSRSERSAAG